MASEGEIAADTRHKITLATVAQATGVAVSTVSRALMNPDRVNAQTRERITKAAARLGYRGPHAVQPASTRTRFVAVLVADVANPFYFGIVRGTQQQLKSAGYTQVLVDTDESESLEFGLLDQLANAVDGVVICASRLPDRQLLDIATRIPVVAINRQTHGVASVFIDTPDGIGQALEHLVSLGHRTIAYASGPEASWSNVRRAHTFDQQCARRGLQPVRLGPYSPKRQAGAAAADAVVNSKATACIAFNDLLAIGMLERLRQRDVRVPADLSIVGCDDIFGADFCNPPLTTLAAPIEQTGRTSVSLLLAQLRNGRPTPAQRHQSTILPTHLTIRNSTGPVPKGAT